MKKKLIFIWLLMLETLTSCQSCSSEYKNVNEIIVEELEIPVPLGDPFILLHNGTYYAYGTHSDEGIEVYISDNLKTWKYKGLALNKKDSWADRWFWAPEVYEVNGKFYMYYSADEHICVAVADSPVGPFIQNKQEPMIVEEKCPPLENRKAGIAEKLRRRALAVLQSLRAARKSAQHAVVAGQHRDEPVAFADRLLLNN